MNVQFQLPVGALVNGWRHLGGGRFAADTTRPSALPPALVEGVAALAGEDLAPIVLEPFDDPMPADCYRVVTVVQRGCDV